MEILFLIVSLIFPVLATPANKSCPVEKVRNCSDYESISLARFHAFLPKTEEESYCKRVVAALQCAAESTENCSLYETLLFDTQRGVIDMICNSRKQEFTKSQACFSQLEVKEAVIKKCMSSVPPTQNLKNPCGNLLLAPTCARDTLIGIKGCSESDAVYMSDLVKAFIKPTVDIFKCPVSLDSIAPTVTEKPAETKAVSRSTTSVPSVHVDLRHVMVQTDNKLSYILSALQPQVEIKGVQGCARDGPIVQVNNFIFLNSLLPNVSSTRT
ncbi:uncharacterized protein LOC106073816 [Biomphalaria glabrata]|uniref:Uncharacterized protein LOC106073816 n=1 Tax=Biomphalaria glabrata TaxID=6526 RepID=A0A9U8EJZ9_BIOGL|nr:uncharacterized protein LOC106073816 [Biomphalaria glabrata]